MKIENESIENDNILTEPIEGKIADVLKVEGKYVVVINKGQEAGVLKGMEFIIYERGKEILDPDSGASLGFLENVKANVKIIQVSQKHSVAQSNEIETTVFDQSESLIPSIFGKKITRVPKILPVDTSASIDEITKEQSIRIGDLVKEMF